VGGGSLVPVALSPLPGLPPSFPSCCSSERAIPLFFFPLQDPRPFFFGARFCAPATPKGVLGTNSRSLLLRTSPIFFFPPEVVRSFRPGVDGSRAVCSPRARIFSSAVSPFFLGRRWVWPGTHFTRLMADQAFRRLGGPFSGLPSPGDQRRCESISDPAFVFELVFFFFGSRWTTSPLFLGAHFSFTMRDR